MKKDSLAPKTDYEIVLQTLENVDDYKYLIERYEKKLFIYIQRILYVNKEDTEDILQEVFIKAYRNLNSYDPKYNFSSWIYRITHNEAISFLRANKKRQLDISNDMENNIFDTIASDIDIEKEAIKDWDSKRVHEVLAKLDSKYREVLVLKYIEEKDYNEISDILQIPSGTVGSLINRAKDKFKKLIK